MPSSGSHRCSKGVGQAMNPAQISLSARCSGVASFSLTMAQTAPGVVVICQISPVSQGGGGLFNAVTVEFDKKQSYFAIPPTSKWVPKFHQNVRVTYRVGHQSGKVRVDAVTPE